MRSAARYLAVEAITQSRIPLLACNLVVHTRKKKDPVSLQKNSTTTFTGSFPIGKKVCIYAHFDSRGGFSNADTHMVRQIANSGVDVIIASTSQLSPHLFGQQKNGLSDIPIVSRENRGFDFGSWAETVLMFRDEVENLDELYLINSSMYGPFAPLNSLFAMNGNDVTALTNSNEFLPHAQSYFLGFSKLSLQHRSFWNFFGSVAHSENKWATIVSSELTWLKYFQAAGFSSNILFPVEKCQRRNPLTFGWADLLNRGFPFVKKSLFLQNYDRIEMRGWQKVVNEIAPDFDVELIERDIWERTQ